MKKRFTRNVVQNVQNENFRLEDRVLFEAAAAEVAAAADQTAEQSAEQAAEQAEAAEQAGEDAVSGEENFAESAAALDDSFAEGVNDAILIDFSEDADTLSFADAPVAAEDTLTIDMLGNGETALSAGRELVIINSTVADKDAVLDSLSANQEVLILNSDSDAMTQIQSYLDNADGKYDAIHIVSHGNDGYFTLNGEKFSAENLNPADWQKIGSHLTQDGDILIYGCDLAETEVGKEFVNMIADASGADVAASTDTTGISGNWELEYQTGLVETANISVNGYNYALESGKVILTAVNDENTEVTYHETLSDALSSATDATQTYTITFDVAAFEAENAETLIFKEGTLNITAGVTITIDGFVDFSDDGKVDDGERIVLDGGVVYNADGTYSTDNAVQILKLSGTNTITLQNLTFQNGYSAGTGTWDGGGAISLDRQTNLTVSNSSFTGNISETGGGAIKAWDHEGFSVNDSTFTNNTALGNGSEVKGGGAVWVNRSIEFSGTNTFTGNKMHSPGGDRAGGSFYAGTFVTVDGTLNIKDSSIVFAKDENGVSDVAVSATHQAAAFHAGSLTLNENASVTVDNAQYSLTSSRIGNVNGAGGYIVNIADSFTQSAGSSFEIKNSSVTIHRVSGGEANFTMWSSNKGGGVLMCVVGNALLSGGDFNITDNTVTISNDTNKHNSADIHGGLLNIVGTLTADGHDIDFTDNKISLSGRTSSVSLTGGYMNVYGALTMTNSTLDFTTVNKDKSGITLATTGGGSASVTGGAVNFASTADFTGSTLNVSGMTISASSAGSTASITGGGVYFGGAATFSDNSSLSASNIKITGTSGLGSTGMNGGGVNFGKTSVFTDSTLTVSNIDLTAITLDSATNTNIYGGGVKFSGTATTSGSSLRVSDITVQGTSSAAAFCVWGGGVSIEGENSAISNLIVENTAGSHGGGVYIGKKSAISYLTIVNTSATEGGAIYVDKSSTVEFSNLTISNTASTKHGGAVFIESGNVELSNATLVGIKSPNGGGIYLHNHKAWSLSLINTTLVMENGQYGLYMNQENSHNATVVILNSILLGATKGDIRFKGALMTLTGTIYGKTADTIATIDANANIAGETALDVFGGNTLKYYDAATGNYTDTVTAGGGVLRMDSAYTYNNIGVLAGKTAEGTIGGYGIVTADNQNTFGVIYSTSQGGGAERTAGGTIVPGAYNGTAEPEKYTVNITVDSFAAEYGEYSRTEGDILEFKKNIGVFDIVYTVTLAAQSGSEIAAGTSGKYAAGTYDIAGVALKGTRGVYYAGTTTEISDADWAEYFAAVSVQENAEGAVFTVTPKAVTVSADKVYIVQNQAADKFTYTVTSGSLVNGDVLDLSYKLAQNGAEVENDAANFGTAGDIFTVNVSAGTGGDNANYIITLEDSSAEVVIPTLTYYVTIGNKTADTAETTTLAEAVALANKALKGQTVYIYFSDTLTASNDTGRTSGTVLADVVLDDNLTLNTRANVVIDGKKVHISEDGLTHTVSDAGNISLARLESSQKTLTFTSTSVTLQNMTVYGTVKSSGTLISAASYNDPAELRINDVVFDTVSGNVITMKGNGKLIITSTNTGTVDSSVTVGDQAVNKTVAGYSTKFYNSADSGIRIDGSVISISNTVSADITAAFGNLTIIGGESNVAFYSTSSGSITITDSLFDTINVDKTGQFRGSALNIQNNDTVVEVNNTTFRNNSAYTSHATGTNCWGGTVFLQTDTATFDNVTFEDNSVSGYGNNVRGSAIASHRGNLIITDSVFRNNSTASTNNAVTTSAAVYYWSGGNGCNFSFKVDNSTFENNDSGTGIGGAILISKYNGKGTVTAEITNSRFYGNTANYGAAISTHTVDDTFTKFLIQGNIFSGNTAAVDGGALYLTRAAELISNTFINNTASGNGGAIWAGHSLTMNNVTIKDSVAGANGGAVYFDRDAGNLVINNLTIENATAVQGGAIYAKQGNVEINNATMTGIKATGDKGAGIWHNEDSNTIAVLNTTLLMEDGSYGYYENITGAKVYVMNSILLGAETSDFYYAGTNKYVYGSAFGKASVSESTGNKVYTDVITADVFGFNKLTYDNELPGTGTIAVMYRDLDGDFIGSEDAAKNGVLTGKDADGNYLVNFGSGWKTAMDINVSGTVSTEYTAPQGGDPRTFEDGSTIVMGAYNGTKFSYSETTSYTVTNLVYTYGDFKQGDALEFFFTSGMYEIYYTVTVEWGEDALSSTGHYKANEKGYKITDPKFTKVMSGGKEVEYRIDDTGYYGAAILLGVIEIKVADDGAKLILNQREITVQADRVETVAGMTPEFTYTLSSGQVVTNDVLSVDIYAVDADSNRLTDYSKEGEYSIVYGKLVADAEDNENYKITLGDTSTLVLESKEVSIEVNTVQDVVDANDKLTSLREAIAKANDSLNPDRIYTITFADSLGENTVTIGSNIDVTSQAAVVIDGGSDITLNLSNTNYAMFYLQNGVNIKFAHLDIDTTSKTTDWGIFKTFSTEENIATLTFEDVDIVNVKKFIETDGTKDALLLNLNQVRVNGGENNGANIFIAIDKGNITVTDSTFTGNKSLTLFSIKESSSVAGYGKLTISGASVFKDNTGTTVLASIAKGDLEITGATFTGNAYATLFTVTNGNAVIGAADVAATEDTAAVKNAVTFSGNTGGTQLINVAAGTLELTNVTAENNKFGNLFYGKQGVTASDITVSGSTANGNDSYLIKSENGNISIENGTFSNNAQQYGVWMSGNSTVTLESVEFTGNTNSSKKIISSAGLLTMTDVTISNDKHTDLITAGNGAELKNVTIQNNTGTGTLLNVTSGNLTVSGTKNVFSGNAHGTLITVASGAVSVSNAEVKNNTGATSAITATSGNLTLTNAEFTDNKFANLIKVTSGNATLTNVEVSDTSYAADTNTRGSITGTGYVLNAGGTGVVSLDNVKVSGTNHNVLFESTGNMTVKNSTFENNLRSDSNSWAVNSTGGTVEITNSTFTNNGMKALVKSSKMLTIGGNTSFTNNSGSDNLFVSAGGLSMTGGTVSGNAHATLVSVTGQSAEISGVTFKNNTGATTLLSVAAGGVTIQNSTFEGNSHGTIVSAAGTSSITGTTFKDNTGTGTTVAVSSGDLTVTDTKFENVYGTAIAMSGSGKLTVSGTITTADDGTKTYSAYFVNTADITRTAKLITVSGSAAAEISDVKFSGIKYAEGNANGAILNFTSSGMLKISNSLFDSNSIIAGSGSAQGLIYVENAGSAVVEISNSQFTNNTVSDRTSVYGGIMQLKAKKATVTGNTFTGNTIVIPASGATVVGGLISASDATAGTELVITGNTFTGNSIKTDETAGTSGAVSVSGSLICGKSEKMTVSGGTIHSNTVSAAYSAVNSFTMSGIVNYDNGSGTLTLTDLTFNGIKETGETFTPGGVSVTDIGTASAGAVTLNGMVLCSTGTAVISNLTVQNQKFTSTGSGKVTVAGGMAKFSKLNGTSGSLSFKNNTLDITASSSGEIAFDGGMLYASSGMELKNMTVSMTGNTVDLTSASGALTLKGGMMQFVCGSKDKANEYTVSGGALNISGNTATAESATGTILITGGVLSTSHSNNDLIDVTFSGTESNPYKIYDNEVSFTGGADGSKVMGGSFYTWSCGASRIELKNMTFTGKENHEIAGDSVIYITSNTDGLLKNVTIENFHVGDLSGALSATDTGGILYLGGVSTEVSGLTLRNNTAENNHGGIVRTLLNGSGTVTMGGTNLLSGNTVRGGSTSDGSIFKFSNLTLTDGASLTVENSTVEYSYNDAIAASGNREHKGGIGHISGVLTMKSGSSLTVQNSDFSISRAKDITAVNAITLTGGVLMVNALDMTSAELTVSGAEISLSNRNMEERELKINGSALYLKTTDMTESTITVENINASLLSNEKDSSIGGTVSLESGKNTDEHVGVNSAFIIRNNTHIITSETGNTASLNGAGLYSGGQNNQTEIRFTGNRLSVFENNRQYGNTSGTVKSSGADITFTGSPSNHGGNDMERIFIFENAKFTATSSADHHAVNGGSVHIRGTKIELKNLTFDGYSASADGGTMYIGIDSDRGSQTLLLEDITIKNSSAGDEGGAIYLTSAKILEQNTFRNVTVENASAAKGAAVYVWYVNQLEIIDSTFTGLKGDGGIRFNPNADNKTLALLNVTLMMQDGDNGIYVERTAADVYILNSIIVGSKTSDFNYTGTNKYIYGSAFGKSAHVTASDTNKVYLDVSAANLFGSTGVTYQDGKPGSGTLIPQSYTTESLNSPVITGGVLTGKDADGNYLVSLDGSAWIKASDGSAGTLATPYSTPQGGTERTGTGFVIGAHNGSSEVSVENLPPTVITVKDMTAVYGEYAYLGDGEQALEFVTTVGAFEIYYTVKVDFGTGNKSAAGKYNANTYKVTGAERTKVVSGGTELTADEISSYFSSISVVLDESDADGIQFTVTPRAVTIKADRQEILVGGTMPTLTYSVTGNPIESGDTLGVSYTVKDADGNIIPADTKFESVATYYIYIAQDNTVEGNGNANYVITADPTPSTLAVMNAMDDIIVTIAEDKVDANDGETSLREAINLANSSFNKDQTITIKFKDELTNITLSEGIAFYSRSSVVIDGEGDIILAKDPTWLTLRDGTRLTFKNLTLEANSKHADAFFISYVSDKDARAELTLDNVTVQKVRNFIGNTDSSYGLVLNLKNSTFQGNSSISGGNLFNLSNSTVTIENTTFSGMTNDIFVLTNSTATITDSIFSGNSATTLLKATGASTVTVSGGTFENNSSTTLLKMEGTSTLKISGGTVFKDTQKTAISMTGSSTLTIAPEEGETVSASFTAGDTATAASSLITLTNSSSAEISGVKVSGVTFSAGSISGGFLNSAVAEKVTVSGSTFENNEFVSPSSGKFSVTGGLIYSSSATGELIISDSTFTGNRIESTTSGDVEISGGLIYSKTENTKLSGMTFTDTNTILDVTKAGKVTISGVLINTTGTANVTLSGLDVQNQTVSLSGSGTVKVAGGMVNIGGKVTAASGSLTVKNNTVNATGTGSGNTEINGGMLHLQNSDISGTAVTLTGNTVNAVNSGTGIVKIQGSVLAFGYSDTVNSITGGSFEVTGNTLKLTSQTAANTISGAIISAQETNGAQTITLKGTSGKAYNIGSNTVSVTLTGSGTVSTYSGGEFYVHADASKNITLEYVNFTAKKTGQTAVYGNGGAIYIGGGTAELTNVKVDGYKVAGDTSTTGLGGGAYIKGTLKLTNVTFDNNKSQIGSGALCAGDVTFAGTNNFTGNGIGIDGSLSNEEGSGGVIYATSVKFNTSAIVNINQSNLDYKLSASLFDASGSNRNTTGGVLYVANSMGMESGSALNITKTTLNVEVGETKEWGTGPSQFNLSGGALSVTGLTTDRSTIKIDTVTITMSNVGGEARRNSPIIYGAAMHLRSTAASKLTDSKLIIQNVKATVITSGTEGMIQGSLWYQDGGTYTGTGNTFTIQNNSATVRSVTVLKNEDGTVQKNADGTIKTEKGSATANLYGIGMSKQHHGITTISFTENEQMLFRNNQLYAETNGKVNANGADIYFSGQKIYTTLDNATFIASTADGHKATNGGSIYAGGYSFTLKNADFTGYNRATGNGGTIYADFSNEPFGLTLENVTITDSKAASGGAVYTGSVSSAILKNVLITGSTATNGGAIYFYGKENAVMTLENVLLYGNTATNGGAVYHNVVNGTLNIVDSTIVENSGNGVYMNQATASLTVLNSIIGWNGTAYDLKYNGTATGTVMVRNSLLGIVSGATVDDAWKIGDKVLTDVLYRIDTEKVLWQDTDTADGDSSVKATLGAYLVMSDSSAALSGVLVGKDEAGAYFVSTNGTDWTPVVKETAVTGTVTPVSKDINGANRVSPYVMGAETRVVTVIAELGKQTGATYGDYTFGSEVTGNMTVSLGGVDAGLKLNYTLTADETTQKSTGGYYYADTYTVSSVELAEINSVADGYSISRAGDVMILTAAGATASQYFMIRANASAQYEIAKKSITVSGIEVKNKTYDGTTSAELDFEKAEYTGKMTGDDLKIGDGSITGTFAGKNVAEGIAVTLDYGNVTLSGADAGNYAFAEGTDSGLKANITKATLTITATEQAAIIYGNDDGFNTGAYEQTGLVNGETLTVVLGLDGGKSTGGHYNAVKHDITFDVTIADSGNQANEVNLANYEIKYEGAKTFTVNKRVIDSVSGITAADKTYDGNKTATLTYTGEDVVLGGMQTGDSLVIKTAAGTFASADVLLENGAAAAQTVTISGITLGGNDVGNYELGTGTGIQTETTAMITRKSITVSGIAVEDKTYDGTTNAKLIFGDMKYEGILVQDAGKVSVDTEGDSITGTFASKNAGKDIAVTLNFGTVELTGDKAGNYYFAAGTDSGLKAEITQAKLTITATAQEAITYGDDTGFNTGAYTTDGLVNGETLTVVLGLDGGTSTGGHYNAETHNITYSNTAIKTTSGEAVELGNYSIDYTPVTFTVNQKDVTSISGITAQSRDYNGTADAVLDIFGLDFNGAKQSGDGLTIKGYSGTFASANASENAQKVTISGIELDGADAANYRLVEGEGIQSETTAKISPFELTAGKITWQNMSSTYNGANQYSAMQGAVSAAIESVQIFTVNGTKDTVNVTVNFGGTDFTDAGTYKLTAVSGNGNYTFADSLTGYTADYTIGAAKLTLTPDAVSSYLITDTENYASISENHVKTLSVNNNAGGAFERDGLTYQLVDEDGNAFDPKKATVGVYNIKYIVTGGTGNYKTNYTVESNVLQLAVVGERTVSPDLKMNVNAGEYGVHGQDYRFTANTTIAEDKYTVTLNYNLTLDADADNMTSGKYNADTYNVSGAEISDVEITDGYTVKWDAAAGTVTVSQGTNTVYVYTIGTLDVSGLTVTIDQKVLTGTIGWNDSVTGNRVYDGTSNAGEITLDWSGVKGIADADAAPQIEFSYANGTYASDTEFRHAGTHTLTVIDNDGNYDLSKLSGLTNTYQIDQMTLTITGGITVNSKDYDGTTDAEFNTVGVIFDKALAEGDSLTVTAEGAFKDKNAGTAKVADITSWTLGGASINDYCLADSGHQNTAQAEIRTIGVTVSGLGAEDKVYDGNDSATVTGTAVFNGMVAGDDLTLATVTAAFSDKHAGTDKTVTFSGLTLAGTDAANYYIEGAETAAADISAAVINVTVTDQADTVYGDSVDAVYTADALSGTDTFTGDIAIDGDRSGSGNLTAGTHNIVIGSLAIDDGNGGKNYQINFTGDSFNVAAKDVTVSGITAENKVYDGTTAATLNYGNTVYDGMIAGDDLAAEAAGTFADSNAADGIAVSLNGLTLTGADAANYVIKSDSQTETSAAITVKYVDAVWVLQDRYTETTPAEDQTDDVSAYYVDVNGNRIQLSVTITQDGAVTPFQKAGNYLAESAGSDSNYRLTDTTRTQPLVMEKAFEPSQVNEDTPVNPDDFGYSSRNVALMNSAIGKLQDAILQQGWKPQYDMGIVTTVTPASRLIEPAYTMPVDVTAPKGLHFTSAEHDMVGELEGMAGEFDDHHGMNAAFGEFADAANELNFSEIANSFYDKAAAFKDSWDAALDEMMKKPVKVK